MTALIWFLDIWLLDPEFPVNTVTVDMYNALCVNAKRKLRKGWESINLTRYVSQVSEGNF